MKKPFLVQIDHYIQNQLLYACLFVLLALLLSSLVVGCSDAEESSNKVKLPSPVQACELLAKNELETLIGAAVNEPSKMHKEYQSSGQWMSMCNYYSDEKQLSVGLTIKPHGKKVSSAEAFSLHEANMKKSLGNEYQLEPVQNIGDKAGWDSSTKQITIFKGPFMLVIGSVNPNSTGPEALKFNKKMAEKILAKLSF